MGLHDNQGEVVTLADEQLSVRRLAFPSGERLSCLVRAGAIPVSLPLRYVVHVMRPKRQAPNTIHQKLDAIRDLYEWAQTFAPPFDPESRLRTGPVMTSREIASLAEVVRSGGRPKVTAMPGGAHVRQSKTGIRSDADMNKRLARVRDFVAWALCEQAGLDRDGSDFKRMIHQFDDELVRVSRGKDRFGLSEEHVKRLLEAVHPDAANNPFNRPSRFRNWVMIQLLLNTGVRRGELCSLRVTDLEGRVAAQPFINVTRKPLDPDDPRTEMPRLKTNEREIPIPRAVFRDCLAYRSHHRGRQRHTYLWVGRGGVPLGLSAVNKLFSRIRKKVFANDPVDLTPHAMRRTFNDRIWAACYADGKTPDQTRSIQNYLSGWSTKSRQAEAYSRRAIQQAAAKVAEAMQEKVSRGLANQDSCSEGAESGGAPS